jgi:cytochrome c553
MSGARVEWPEVLQMQTSLTAVAFGVEVMCDICERTPCKSPTFCAACRKADRKAAAQPQDRRTRDRPAQEATIEALMFSLRESGVKAIEEPATKRRLDELSDEQVIEVGNRLQRLKPNIALAWSAEEVEILLQARGVLDEHRIRRRKEDF